VNPLLYEGELVKGTGRIYGLFILLMYFYPDVNIFSVEKNGIGGEGSPQGEVNLPVGSKELFVSGSKPEKGIPCGPNHMICYWGSS